jgi:hypothetical protein
MVVAFTLELLSSSEQQQDPDLAHQLQRVFQPGQGRLPVLEPELNRLPVFALRLGRQPDLLLAVSRL